MLCRIYHTFDQNPLMPSCHIRLTSYKIIHTDTHADIPLQRSPKSLLESSLTISSKVSLLHAIATATTASISSLRTPSLFPPQSFYTCCLLEWNAFLIAVHRLSFCLNVTSAEKILAISIKNIWPSPHIPINSDLFSFTALTITWSIIYFLSLFYSVSTSI